MLNSYKDIDDNIVLRFSKIINANIDDNASINISKTNMTSLF